MFRKSVLVAAMLVGGVIPVASAQDAVLDELYGRGVHRFFANDYLKAYENFSLAIEHGSQDPRVYYFRGLTALATGRPEEAEADWRTGATIEARGAYGGLIGRSLSRIQGPTRMEIERIRQMAQLEARSQSAARDRARYQGLNASEDRPAVRPAPAAPPAQPTPPPSPAAPPSVARPTPAPTPPPAPGGGGANNPFADDDLMVEGEPTIESPDALSGSLEAAQPEPIAPEAAGTDNPPPALEGDGDTETNPFGVPSGDDPFGGPADGDEENPFEF